MRVVETLGVPASLLWGVIVDSAAAEAAAAAGKDSKSVRVRVGLSYLRQMSNYRGKPATARVRVTELEPESRYAVEVYSPYGTYHVSYVLSSDVDTPERTTVTYEETYSGKTASKDINQKLMALIFAPFARRRVRKTLRAIEEHLNSQQAEGVGPEETENSPGYDPRQDDPKKAPEKPRSESLNQRQGAPHG